MTTSTLTDVEKINRLPWLAAADTLTTSFALLTFAGPVFLLFLDFLGMDKTQIGLLLSLVPFAGIVAPFIAPWVARFGYKRVYLTFWATRNLVMALLLLTPVIVARFGAGRTFIWVAGVIFVFALCRAIAETGGYPWKKEAVPDSIRGKFTAINNILGTLGGIIITTIASFVIDSGTGLNRFMILIGLGVGLGLIGVFSYWRVPGGAPVRQRQAGSGHLHSMGQAVRDRDFVFFLIALGLATLGGASVISFIPLFMKEQVGLSDGNVVLLSVGTYAGAVISSYLWGWAADRYGSKPVMQTSLYLMMLLPIAWFLMPRQSSLSMPVAVAIAVVAGLSTLAWQISWMRYLFVNAIPAEQKSPYMAVYYAWFGLVNGSGPLVAGRILDLSDNLRIETGIFTIDPFAPLFGLSLVLLFAGVITVSRLRSDEATPFRRFAGMFVRGNAIKAFGSLIQYNFSGDEMTRVEITERMGEARNPLSENELIEALRDPSFNVRYQAIQSIGRMPTQPELVDALLEMLEEGHSELSFVVTRSLGRLGDPRAIEPLRALLFSGYHLLEANSARALAMLGDQESIPHLLHNIKNDPNRVVRIAYASALGRLGSTEAVDDIFALLRQTKSEVLRAEVGLALARLAGDERYYMQQWRSIQANPNTATAQDILALQRSARSLNIDGFVEIAETCAMHFAQGEAGRGASQLEEMICQLPIDRLDPALVKILQGCADNLDEFGPARLEFILLSLHTIDIALKQLNGPGN